MGQRSPTVAEWLKLRGITPPHIREKAMAGCTAGDMNIFISEDQLKALEQVHERLMNAVPKGMLMHECHELADQLSAILATAKRVEVDECLHACKRRHPHTQLRLTRSIAPDTNWHWTVVMPDGHTYDISKGPLTFEQAVTDLQGRGVIALDAADTIWRRNAAIQAALGEGEGE